VSTARFVGCPVGMSSSIRFSVLRARVFTTVPSSSFLVFVLFLSNSWTTTSGSTTWTGAFQTSSSSAQLISSKGHHVVEKNVGVRYDDVASDAPPMCEQVDLELHLIHRASTIT
jgi:hypothetical protein